MMTMKLVMPMLLLAMLAACERQAEAPVAPVDAAEDKAFEDVERPGSPAAVGPDAAPEVVPPDAAMAPDAFTPADSLPATRILHVAVEGQTDAREATLFKSPQGYAIYVLPQLRMTPEEPCCDIAFARVDDGSFMRIERIDAAADLATLRENMELGLSAVGTPTEAPQDVAGNDAAIDVELSMRARGDDTTVEMLVARIDGGRYRVTRHLPHREALEGIPASMYAMLGSLRTTGPRPDI